LQFAYILDTEPEIGITPILTVLLAFWRSKALHYYNYIGVITQAQEESLSSIYRGR
jgi:hypothetical protein